MGIYPWNLELCPDDHKPRDVLAVSNVNQSHIFVMSFLTSSPTTLKMWVQSFGPWWTSKWSASKDPVARGSDEEMGRGGGNFGV